MRYVIMANGRGSRWGYHLGTQKHLIKIDGESLLQRIVRQLQLLDPDPDVVISSSNPCYEVEGARRHSPIKNEIELDRFVPELVTEEVCFLYGDTYYSEDAMRRIVNHKPSGLNFYGDLRSIVAVKSNDQQEFHYHLENVRSLFLEGKIENCIGWQLYQSYAGLPFDMKRIDRKFLVVTGANGFNTPQDFNNFLSTRKSRLSFQALQHV